MLMSIGYNIGILWGCLWYPLAYTRSPVGKHLRACMCPRVRWAYACMYAGAGGVRAMPFNLVVPTGIQKKPKLKKEYIPYASL